MLELRAAFMRTDAQLRKLGEDLYKGLIYRDLQMPPNQSEQLGMVFVPIYFMDKKAIAKFKKKKPYVLFEYLDRAGPRSVNGMPMFMSFQFCTKPEWKKVVAYYEAINK
mgnify:FL=1